MEDPGIDPGSQPCEGCMLPCTTIPHGASIGTRTRTYTLEGCNSTLKLRMQGKRHSPSGGVNRAGLLSGNLPPERLNGRVV